MVGFFFRLPGNAGKRGDSYSSYCRGIPTKISPSVLVRSFDLVVSRKSSIGADGISILRIAKLTCFLDCGCISEIFSEFRKFVFCAPRYFVYTINMLTSVSSRRAIRRR